MDQQKKQENLGERSKGRRAIAWFVGKRGGQATPVLSTWRLLQQQQEEDDDDNIKKVTALPSSVSVRKLAATLWELHQYGHPLFKIYQGVSLPPSTLRRHQRRRGRLFQDMGLERPDRSLNFLGQPASASSLKRHVGEALMQNHRSDGRKNRAVQPLYPASYSSSLEVVGPYNPAATPTSSLDFKVWTCENGYRLQTSSELIKVLDRICKLEDQHASNISLVKAMKKEHERSRARIKELVREQQANRQKIDELLKQIAEDKHVRKCKEQDHVSSAIQSLMDELEEERKLRKRSESLHRKLAQELYKAKTSFANALKELERERVSRKLLEDLCDKFALGIRDYQQEMHALKQKSDNVRGDEVDEDRLILRLSESWLNERIQAKLETQYGSGEKNLIVDKLSTGIETFLHAKRIAQQSSSDDLELNNPTFRHNPAESTPLNVAVDATQVDASEESYAGSDLHCFELNKSCAADLKLQADHLDTGRIKEIVQTNCKDKIMPQERTKGRNPTSMQAKFQEQMSQAVSRYANRNMAKDKEHVKFEEGIPIEIGTSKKSEIGDAIEEGSNGTRNGNSRPNSNSTIDDLIRNYYNSPKSGNKQPGNDTRVSYHGDFAWRSRASPVQKWSARLPSQDLDVPASSSTLPPGLKEKKLKAKLVESRTRRQCSQSRLRSSKICF